MTTSNGLKGGDDEETQTEGKTREPVGSEPNGVDTARRSRRLEDDYVTTSLLSN
jgi:hypothetical protein